jgi:hypothetical protein
MASGHTWKEGQRPHSIPTGKTIQAQAAAVMHVVDPLTVFSSEEP